MPRRSKSLVVVGPAIGVLVLVVVVAFAIGQRRATLRYRSELEQVRQMMDRDGHAARRSLADLASRWPGRGEPLLLLGQCEELSRHPEAAVAAWEQIPPGDPSFVTASESLGSVLINEGHFAPAELALLHALQVAPQDDRYPILRVLARLLRLQGRFGEVADVLIAGWSSAPDPSDLLQDLWQNDTESVPVEAWKFVLDRADTQDDRVWLGAARLALLTGRDDDARTGLSRCLQCRPRDLAVWGPGSTWPWPRRMPRNSGKQRTGFLPRFWSRIRSRRYEPGWLRVARTDRPRRAS